MASTLKAAGFHVHLDRDEDVYFEISGVPCFMECKRVQSQRKLGERIGHAADQVRKRCDNSRDLLARGIVAVDVSKLLNAGTHLFDCATRDALSFEAERKLELFRVEHMPSSCSNMLGLSSLSPTSLSTSSEILDKFGDRSNA